MTSSFYNSWIEISESAYAQNLAFFRKVVGNKPELSAVIKANGYGHGWHSIARLAVKHGADSFCVHSIDEAHRLRRAGFVQNILIMGDIPLSRLHEAVDLNCRIIAINRDTVLQLEEAANSQNRLARVHLKLETGTYRQGIGQEELTWFLEKFKKTPRILLEAVYTHFADIEDTTDHDYAEYQQYCFNQLVKIVRASGFPILKKHAACTAAAMLFPEIHFDMVRLGLGQYGLWPSRETMVSYMEKYGKKARRALAPVLSWKSRIVQIKDVDADNTVGYGRTYKTTRSSRIAVLPVGYSDGYPRALSNKGYVLIHGKRAPVRGRVCMNLMMVDVTDIPEANLNAEVILIGSSEKESITIDDMSRQLDTINYEVASRLNRDIVRIIVD